ncbi:MAG: hypothetical protein QM768_21675 [Agriterribacter sp.]
MQVFNKQRVIYQFEDRWKESFGTPERLARWFITGPPFSGKSSLCFQLCKYLTQFGVVGYNNYEEGDSQTVADKLAAYGLLDADNFKLIPGEPVEDFKKRMLRRQAPAFGVIDSVQHAAMDKKTYVDFVNALSNNRRGKGLVFINHWVKNELTKYIKHDCGIKIEVIGYVAYVQSRYGGCNPFVIWEEGAKRYWGKKYNSVIAGRYWPGQKK